MKKIQVKLSVSSIENAINELKAYETELHSRILTYVNALVQEGVKVANVCVASTQGDSDLPAVVYDIDSQGDIVKARIAITGKDVLFVEFGAGIAYNTGAQHPYADELGYGVGTYPSEHPPNKAINPGRWIYGHNDDGTPIWSIGTEATMPIYHAAETVRNNTIIKATELLRG